MNIKISLQAWAQKLTLWGSKMEEYREAGGIDPEGTKALDQISYQAGMPRKQCYLHSCTSETVKGPF